MTIDLEHPITYGEHYAGIMLEVDKAFAEIEEQAIKPFIPAIFSDPDIREAMPFDILGKLERLFEFESPGLGGVGGRFISEIADQAVSMVMTPALRKTQYAANRVFQNMIVNPDVAMELFRRRGIEAFTYNYRFRAAGYNEAEQKLLETASVNYPGIPDLIRWSRYQVAPENLFTKFDNTYQIDPKLFELWEWQTRQQFTTDQVINLWQREIIDDTNLSLELRRLGWGSKHIQNITTLGYEVPNAMLLYQGNLFAEADPDKVQQDFKRAKISPDDMIPYIDAVLAKPAAMDLIQYHLRQENELADLNTDLRKIGVHPSYFDVYNALALPIPPVADIISMAVREAFSPATAARFGQYEDLPPDFVKYAGMKGLSEEWAERYWAAHWNLPSAQQGFAMLHRGIIEEGDLTLLLKALDVMPFWRDRLVQLAFKPLTRVDVRRMYSLGVLNESDVLEAYEQLGYSPERAGQMTEYTIQQVLMSMAKFSSRDVIAAYTDRKINSSQASSLLSSLGVQSGDIGYILSTADYKKEWSYIDGRIRAIRNLYRKGQNTQNDARTQLLGLNLPSDEVDNLMDQWYFEKAGDGVQTLSKAETLKYLKGGMIDEPRARQELALMDYDEERINLYIKSVTWTKPD
ncbi:hypothetical protein LCGC14_0872370 [marine sediment metagenome]|uniref:Uncharacterized protein n=1 Tax=marine sediment metagenome TaxID=412755 RepID=A0A0F9P4A2_9ZZZZ